ncbi:MAG: 50S ribosomal protein L4 [Clostridiales bacterium]|jgi:large subunit ribosomal protein L4|nr:50S ribosomal protein L4 [Clostridiales bacterium]
MPNVKVYKQTGEDAGTLLLSDAVFGAAYNGPLIHSVVVSQRNNARQGTVSALTRAEVRGGGKKPWRQKHTGRARQGSTRSPQWTGGGIIFAKKPRDFSTKVNKTAKRQALKSALSAKVTASEFIVLEDLKLAAPKTKEVFAVLNNLKLDKSVLLVLPAPDAEILRAARNLQNVEVTFADLINVYDLVANDKCLITKDAVKKIEEAYS